MPPNDETARLRPRFRPVRAASTMSDGGPERRVYTQMRGIEQVRVRAPAFSGAAVRPRIALVAAQDVGQDVCLVGRFAPRPQLRCTRRAARTSGLAVTKIFTSAPGAMTVPISRPSSTAPRRLGARMRAGRSAAPRAPAGWPATTRGRLADGLRSSGRCRRMSPDRARARRRWRARRRRAGSPASSSALRHGAVEQPGVEMVQPVDAARRSARERALARAAGPSMAMIMTNPRPSPRINSTKPGKLVAMKVPSSTCTGCSLRKPQHQGRHGDAVIHVGGDDAAAGGVALAVHDQIVAVDLDGDAVGAQQRGGGGEAVGFLDPQLLRARASPSCPRRRPRPPRAPDIRRSSTARAPPARRRRAARRRARADRRRPRRPRCACRARSIDGAHLGKRREQAGAQRIDHHAVEDHVGAGHDQRGDQREGRRGRIGRHHDRPRHEFRLAGQRDAAAAVAIAARPAPARRNAVSIFSVWSRVASASITMVSPGAARPASSTADFTCAEAPAARNTIGIGSRAPGKRQRQPPPSVDASVRAPIRSSGSSMRRIGRVRSEASPSKVAVIGQPATAPA